MSNENIAAEAETLTNDNRRSDLNKMVKRLGEEAALGKDSLPKLAHAVVKAAADGVIKPNDAEDIYSRYLTAESKKAMHEHSAGGLRANASKLRQLIVMGEMTTIDAVQVMQDAWDAREEMVKEAGEAEGADKPKFKSAYPYYVDVARAQQKSDKPLGKDEFRELAVKPTPTNEKDVEGELKAILKRLEALVTGENKHGLKDDHDNTEAAFHLIKERVDQFATLRAQQKLREDAAALGIKLAE